jgi:hypothetical protein
MRTWTLKIGEGCSILGKERRGTGTGSRGRNDSVTDLCFQFLGNHFSGIALWRANDRNMT